MIALFSTLLVISIILFFIGMKKPTYVIFWGVGSKKHVTIFYSSLVIIFIVLIYIFHVIDKVDMEKQLIIEQEVAKATKAAKIVKKPIIKYSKLAVTKVTYKDNKIIVVGSSDLPDNSMITVKVVPIKDSAAGTDSQSPELISKTTLHNGVFTCEVNLLDKQQYYAEKYKVIINFTPGLQMNKNVLIAVGIHGENLIGKLVYISEYTEYKSLIFSMVKTITALKMKSYPMVNPKNYTPDGPKKALALFLVAWKNQDWNSMVKYSYSIWVKEKKNPEKLIKKWFSTKKLVGAEIFQHVTIKNEILQEVQIKIHYYQDGKFLEVSCTIKVIEDDNTGQWGVFPISFIKKDAKMIFRFSTNNEQGE